MTTITVDGLNEEEFRRSIERNMRHGQSDKAVARLRSLLEPFAGPGGILPDRFLTIDSSQLALHGWDGLADRMRKHDRAGRPVSALSIAFGWPGEDLPRPDDAGCLTPLIETGYYSDDAFPFSQSAREDLLDGYSLHGCSWSNDYEGCDHDLIVAGIDDLHGALTALEERLLASEEPDEDEIRAGSLGACLLSVLLFQAVGAKIAQAGLPRPVCVLAGSNGVYPYFDAPVVGIPEEALKAAEIAEEEALAAQGAPPPRYSSLLVTGIPRARKRAVLVLDESENEMEVRLAALRGLNRDDAADRPGPAAAEPQESAIAPLAKGPLLVKKPSGQQWDFRDMLGPRDADPFQGEASRDEPFEEPRASDLPPPAPAPSVDRPALPPQSNLRLPQADPIRFDLPPPEPLYREPAAPPPAVAPVVSVPPIVRAPAKAVSPVPDPIRANLASRAPPPPIAAPAPRPRFPSQAPVGPGFASLEPELQDRLEALLAPQPEPSPSPAPLAPDPEWSAANDRAEEVPVEPQREQVPARAPGLLARLKAWIARR